MRIIGHDANFYTICPQYCALIEYRARDLILPADNYIDNLFTEGYIYCPDCELKFHPNDSACQYEINYENTRCGQTIV